MYHLEEVFVTRRVIVKWPDSARPFLTLFAHRCALFPARDRCAPRLAEIADATVFASIDVTDQSMGRGPSFRDREYSRRNWVRFSPDRAVERLNTRVIDARSS
jgi:hypothetical protein